jgi:uncharacterized Zn-binding protein involved in type VI secretion
VFFDGLAAAPQGDASVCGGAMSGVFSTGKTAEPVTIYISAD